MLLFDFDGVLADSYPIVFSIMNNLAKEHGYKEIKDKEYARNHSFRELAKKMNVPMIQLPAISKLVLEELRKHKIKPVKGIKQILNKLKKKHRLGILTSNKTEIVEKFLSENKITCFEFICHNSFIFGKQKDLKKIIKKHNLQVEDVYYIADEVRDIKACEKAGIKCISVCWGFKSEKLLKKYNDKLARKPEDLLKIDFNNL